jgi:hypothetical protein
MHDIDDIRRENLKSIESEAGGTTAAATRLGMSVAQFSNLREGAKDSKTGKPRGMRKETARKIEAAANKPIGWLDQDHKFVSNVIPAAPALSASLDALTVAIAAQPQQAREALAKDLAILAVAPRDPETKARVLAALEKPRLPVETADFSGKPPAAVQGTERPHFLPKP